jgi:DnaJ-class molecular chaperone
MVRDVKFMRDFNVGIYIAYDVLSNAEKRRIYDRHGEDGLKNGGQQQRGFDPFDIFAKYDF